MMMILHRRTMKTHSRSFTKRSVQSKAHIGIATTYGNSSTTTYIVLYGSHHHHHHRHQYTMLRRVSLPLFRRHWSPLSSSLLSIGSSSNNMTAIAQQSNNAPPSSLLSLSSQSCRSITQTSFVLPDHSVSYHPNDVNTLQLTKIVATIGPTSEQAEPLQQVVQAGMRIMRLNFSHATKEEVELRCTNLAAAQQVPQDVRAILLDTKGPEIRTGKLQDDLSGHHTVTLEKGHSIALHTAPLEAGSTATDLFIDYPSLHKAVQPGYKVLLDDGAIILTVEQIDAAGTVQCRIENSGDLRSRAGVNLPLADTSDLPAMSAKDKADILYGMTKDIDFVAASFVQTANHVQQIRQYIQECAAQLNWPSTQPLPLIISKIETAGALQHFDEILAESDGIMVARGDLGVEIPLQQVTNAQKEMVAACNAAGKPVIVATQMLESMSKNPRPTRAEVSDVTNAVYDGADAVMCSGETAKGKYPTETVKMMNEIIRSAEQYARVGALAKTFTQNFVPDFSEGAETADVAIAKAAVTAVKERKCVAVLVFTNNNLPGLVAAFRPAVPILAFCESAKIGRQLQLHRGVHPIVGSAENAMEEAKSMGYLEAGDEVVIVSVEDGEKSGEKSAVMKIATVP